MIPTIIAVLLFVFVNFDKNKAALEKNKKIFCFYDTNSFDNYDDGNFDVQNINSEYCTHLIYGKIEIGVDGTVQSAKPSFDFGINDEIGNIRIFNEKKERNKNLKTLFFVGGLNTEPRYYTDVFSSEKNTKTFVESSIEFAIQHNFDGVVLNWRWRRTSGELLIDITTLNSLLKNLKSELEQKNLLLVVYFYNFIELLGKPYNVKKIAEKVDYIMLDSVYYFTYWSAHIGVAAGLYLHAEDYGSQLNTDPDISDWISFGAPPEKILVSITLSGNKFTLGDKNKTKRSSQSLTYDGGITYMKLCQKLSNESWTIKWEDTQKNPYAFKGNQWVGYENERSLQFKAKYVIEKNLGGVVTNGQAFDDFRGLCGEKYPLHQILNTYLRPIDESIIEYIVNINVFERNLDDMSIQCVYHNSKILSLG